MKGNCCRGEWLRGEGELHLSGLDADFGDAAAIHFDDGHAAVLPEDVLAGSGDVAEAEEEKAGEGFNATIAGEAPLHLGFKVAEVDAAIHEESAGRGGDDGARGVVEFVVRVLR